MGRDPGRACWLSSAPQQRVIHLTLRSLTYLFYILCNIHTTRKQCCEDAQHPALILDTTDNTGPNYLRRLLAARRAHHTIAGTTMTASQTTILLDQLLLFLAHPFDSTRGSRPRSLRNLISNISCVQPPCCRNQPSLLKKPCVLYWKIYGLHIYQYLPFQPS
jgi:hypothetical protein